MVPGSGPDDSASVEGLRPGHRSSLPCTTVPLVICVRGLYQTKRDCYQMIDVTPASQLCPYTVVFVLSLLGVMSGAVGPRTLPH